MFKKSLLLFVTLSGLLTANAQTDTSRLRISLLTCGTGPEVWETFGHTAIRVTDSAWGTDNVYNYGTFAFSDDFALQFMQGKLLYYLSFYPYENFLSEYTDANRSVEEQLLLMDGNQKRRFFNFLKDNALTENREYKYDFFYDNCATRIRDAFPKAMGNGFVYGKTIAAEKRLTFRNIINQYYYRKHWERYGINLLLGSPIDKVMSSTDLMFLPDFLRDGVAGATLNGKPVAAPSTVIADGSPKLPAGLNGPFVLNLAVATLTILGLTLPSLKTLGKFMSFFLLLISGLLGCLIVVMWLGTDHQGCRGNTNILWALPTNLLLAFAPKGKKGRYALLAIMFMVLALIFHVVRIQELPLVELWPMLLALLFVYGTIYRKNMAVNTHGAIDTNSNR